MYMDYADIARRSLLGSVKQEWGGENKLF